MRNDAATVYLATLFWLFCGDRESQGGQTVRVNAEDRKLNRRQGVSFNNSSTICPGIVKLSSIAMGGS